VDSIKIVNKTPIEIVRSDKSVMVVGNRS